MRADHGTWTSQSKYSVRYQVKKYGIRTCNPMVMLLHLLQVPSLEVGRTLRVVFVVRAAMGCCKFGGGVVDGFM